MELCRDHCQEVRVIIHFAPLLGIPLYILTNFHLYPNPQKLKHSQSLSPRLSLFSCLLYHICPHVKSDESSHILISLLRILIINLVISIPGTTNNPINNRTIIFIILALFHSKVGKQGLMSTEIPDQEDRYSRGISVNFSGPFIFFLTCLDFDTSLPDWDKKSTERTLT